MENHLKQYLEELLGRPLSLVLTENSTSMLSARVHNGVLCVRLHRMFLNADIRVISEIVLYLKKRRGAMPHFQSFIRDNRAQLNLKPPKKVLVRTAGKFHDLCGLYDEINKEYFGCKVNALITWGTRSPRYAVRKRTVGSYSERSNTIRINPVLDKKTVPRYYVALIVYHEMLHAAMGTPLRGKRRSVHSLEFRTREKLFKDYEKAMAWEGGKP
jgi:predicted metal-dependent hydrolase